MLLMRLKGIDFANLKPLSLIILVLCLMTIILISILSFYRLENALDKKVQLFSDAIDHKNTDQLIELVISNNQQLTNEEAKAYVSFDQFIWW